MTIFGCLNTVRLKKPGALLGGALLIVTSLIARQGVSDDKPARPSLSAAASGPIPSFSRDIAPILQASCLACHSAEKPQGQLRLDSEAALLKGGVTGKAIIPGNSRDSLLVQRLLGDKGTSRMPFGGDPLPKEKIDLIRTWIDQNSFAETSVDESGVTSKTSHSPVARESTVFTAQIRPILAARCYACHGPDVQQNGLRLDSLVSVLKGSQSGRVIASGNSQKSSIMRRLLGLDRPQMPYGAPPLTAEQIDLIRRWIDEGAPGPDSTEPIVATKSAKHWAYTPLGRPEMPNVKKTAWIRNPIDNFILGRLEREGLSPSSEADRETLIRRVSLDLTGLPPSPQEVDAFLADTDSHAYEKWVDQLLASPHYGERWARPWLDLGRYGDSQGYEKDDLRIAWKYRDWVINALNQNMSFKEFTIDQIAGDMLPNPTLEQLIATGFHRNTLLNQEGGVDDEEARWETLLDRVNTTASVWLGTTLACAQCHNHKYDPFTQKDYYRFLAFFDNGEYKILNLGQGEGWVVEPELELPTTEQEAKSKELRAEITRLQTVLNTSTPELEAAQAEWETEMKRADSNWTVLRPSAYSSLGGATLQLRGDQSILAGGKNPEADTYLIQAETKLAGVTGVRLEVLGDPSLPKGGPGRDPEGNFFLSSLELEAAPAGKKDELQKIVFKDAQANESQEGYEISNLVKRGQESTGWAIDVSPSNTPPRRQAVLLPEKPFGSDVGTVLTIRLKHELRRASRNIGRLRLSITSAADPKSTVRLSARLWPVLETPVPKRSEEQKAALAAAFRSISPLLQPTRDRIAEIEKSIAKLGIETALILRDRRTFDRPSTHLRIRGSYLSKGEKVYAGAPAVLNSLPETLMPNRLGLAYWLVDEKNPLTARVTVNRFWEQIFGRGIVETSENFGTQGERPTHPELLDWLATEFTYQGWNMKALLRLLVTSATYRQSSLATPELMERDSYNKLLARGPRFRVEAEMVRDIPLAASGLLSHKIGGPSVFPYQPEGIWDRPYSDDKWVMSEGEDRYRRGIYTFIRRTSPYPSLFTFDAPSREFCTVRRVRTNTPLQALTTLNDPAFVEAARALAKRIMTEAGTDPAGRVTYGFRLCLSRRPAPKELDRLIAFHNQQLDRFQREHEAASAMVQGITPPAADIPDLAAWIMVSNVLLNLDEVITKE